jgi:hypothetical protein
VVPYLAHAPLPAHTQDAVSTVGACTFLQVGVMGQASTRDGRRQSRFIQGTSEKLKIWSINHHKRLEGGEGAVEGDVEGDAELRLDAEVDLKTGNVEILRQSDDYSRTDWFGAYVPEERDG